MKLIILISLIVFLLSIDAQNQCSKKAFKFCRMSGKCSKDQCVNGNRNNPNKNTNRKKYCNKVECSIVVTGAIPDNFVKVSSWEVISHGRVHAQDVHYNEATDEAILISPAHNGYPNKTTVITTKNSTHADKILDCYDSVCHLEDAHPVQNLHPSEFAKRSSSKTKKIRADKENMLTIYTVRSNIRPLTTEELGMITGTMKHVSKGKEIVTSDKDILTEMPDSSVEFFDLQDRINEDCGYDYKKKKACFVAPLGCKYSEPQNSQFWLLGDITITAEEIAGTEVVHGVEVNRYCSYCCNGHFIGKEIKYVACEDFKENFPYRDQAMYTGVAQTWGEVNNEQPKCFGPYTNGVNYWDPNCDFYGYGYPGHKIGACKNREYPTFGQC